MNAKAHTISGLPKGGETVLYDSTLGADKTAIGLKSTSTGVNAYLLCGKDAQKPP